MPKIICRCEDLTEEEILGFVREGYTTIDEIKRVSRASMGHCQGRTCKRLIAQIISRETDIPTNEIVYPTPRPPIKPVPLKVLANVKE